MLSHQAVAECSAAKEWFGHARRLAERADAGRTETEFSARFVDESRSVRSLGALSSASKQGGQSLQ